MTALAEAASLHCETLRKPSRHVSAAALHKLTTCATTHRQHRVPRKLLLKQPGNRITEA